jgi:hypothetical protein
LKEKSGIGSLPRHMAGDGGKDNSALKHCSIFPYRGSGDLRMKKKTRDDFYQKGGLT